jgi:murein DD-endopeptidase / murein LD-carboxypeptidase
MKMGSLFCILFILNASCQSYSQQEAYHYNKGYDYKHDTLRTHPFHVDSLVNFARQFVGLPYKATGKTPEGFDCSGFSFYCFKAYGIYLPYSSTDQATLGKEIPEVEAEAGDLIFFQGQDINDKTVHHVGILVNKKGEKLHFIHSSTSHGVRYDTLDSPYYKPRFVNIKRVH